MANPKRLSLAILASSLVITGLYALSGGGGFPLDDSWIHQGYARNLAEHGEWSLAPGDPSAASTSPLYVVLLAIGYETGVAFPLWTFALGAVALASLALLIARMSARLGHCSSAWLWLPAALTLGTWHLVWSAVAGMETIVFCLLTMTLLYWAWQPQSYKSSALDRRHAIPLGLLSGLLSLARPEGILLGVMVLVAIIASERSGSFNAKRCATEGKRRRILCQAPASERAALRRGQLLAYIICALFSFAVIVLPYAFLNWTLTGALLPTSVAAKLLQHEVLLGLPIVTRAINIMIPVLAGSQVLLLPGLAIYVYLAIRGRLGLPKLIAILPLLWIAALIALYAAKLPVTYQHGRYMIPTLPPIILCGSIGLAHALNRSRSRRIGRILSRSWLGAVLASAAVYSLFVGPVVFHEDVAIVNQEMVGTAEWIKANVAENDLVAGHDIGAFAYFAKRSIVDLAGLLTPEMHALFRDTDAIWDLLESRGVAYIFGFPHQIPGRNAADKRLCPVFSTRGQAALDAGGHNMAVYRLAWNGACSQER